MANVFISYASPDRTYAQTMYTHLVHNNISAWYAPVSIPAGGSFTDEIAHALSETEDYRKHQNVSELGAARVCLLILSQSAMDSDWVIREITLAVNHKIPIIPVQIDNAALTDNFSFLLTRSQIIPARRLSASAIPMILETVKKYLPSAADPVCPTEQALLDMNEFGIRTIASGDPYFTEHETIHIRLSRDPFFLAVPDVSDINVADDLQHWIDDHHMHTQDLVFRSTLEAMCAAIPIADLPERIERSRKKIFLQFLNRENGCYFNNKKYGIYSINPFARSEDPQEMAALELTLFETDYFTHRVMKDVCKELAKEKNPHLLRGINYSQLQENRIFFTSLGVNLLLAEDSPRSDASVLLTCRSTNAAETNGQQLFSLSVIEGVSISDYDTYKHRVRLSFAVERGLKEELGVDDNLIQQDSLKYHNLFVNTSNLEMGLACSILLSRGKTIGHDVMNKHGKDELLEVADKRIVPIRELGTFVHQNQKCILPQALHTLCSYLEHNGIRMTEKYASGILSEETFLQSHLGDSGPCGDAIFKGEDFIAVIDGATPKGRLVWDGLPADAYIAQVIKEAISRMNPDISATEAIAYINNCVRSKYEAHGVCIDSLKPEEHLQASIIIFSAKRKEVWCFGDCLLRINQRTYDHSKKIDTLLSDLRAFIIEGEKIQGHDYTNQSTDVGRDGILPFLKLQALFANTNYSFGYDVINGGKIHSDHVKIYAIKPGDRVIMASDGYPRIFDTLRETEDYLHRKIQEDPECIYALRGTKGIQPGHVSYDDRSYISFIVD